MPDQLVVHLNREGVYEIEPASESFETDRSFEVVLYNHGQAVHVHLRLDETLSSVAAVEESNHFVDTESTEVVAVQAASGRSTVEGALEIVTGYGSGTELVDVRIEEPHDPSEPTVAVDESLARPRPEEEEISIETVAETLLRDERPVVIGIVLVALVLAAVALAVAPSLPVVLGVLTVFLGVGIAAYLVVSPRLNT